MAAQGHTPPKDLVQDIRDAEKAGQTTFQIQPNAVDSGWPIATVTEALTYVRDEDAAYFQTNQQGSGLPTRPWRPNRMG